MYLSTLLQSISPAAFAAQFATPGSITETQGVVTCEFPNTGRMKIHANGFVAVDISSSLIKGGTIVDMLAALRPPSKAENWKLHPYARAIIELTEVFKDNLPPGATEEGVQRSLAEEAKLQRRIYNVVVCQSDDAVSIPGGLAMRARKELGGVIKNGCISYLGLRKMRHLKERLAEAKITDDLVAQPAIVVPYFVGAGTISCIHVLYAHGQSVQVWLTPHKHGIAGLLATSPNQLYFVHPTLADMLREISQCAEDEAAHLHVLRRPIGTASPWLPSRVLCVMPEHNKEWQTAIDLNNAGVTCLVTSKASINYSAGNAQLWSDAVLHEITEMITCDNEFSPRVLNLLNTVKSDYYVKANLRLFLQDSGKYWLMQELDQLLRDQVLWAQGDSSLYATAGGYYYESSNTKSFGGDAVSNFTLNPLHSIRYETGEIFYVCELRLKQLSDYRTLKLPASSFDTTKKLIDTIQREVSLSRKPPSLTPAIFDHNQIRALIPWLYKQYSTLEVKTGITSLGWNGARTQYSGVWWFSNEDIVKRGAICKPGIDYLSYFEDPTVDICSNPKGIPSKLMQVAYQCAAVIERARAGYELSVIPYSSNKETRESLQALFARIGQPRVLQLNQNMRNGDLNCLSGYPFLATGYNRRQAKTVKVGMFLLGEEGASLPVFADHEYDQAAGYIRWILEKLPCCLIANWGTNFTLSTNPLSADALAAEGSLILKSCDLNTTT